MFSARATEAWGAPEAIQALYLLERRLDLASTTEPVYLGRDRATGHRLWLKCTDGTAESVNRLAAEARILAGISHPHILPLQAELTAEEAPYLLYPWQAEQPLSADNLARIPPADRVRLAGDLVGTVQYLQKLTPPVAHGRLVLESLWLTPLVHWLRLAGFNHAVAEAEKEALRADREATAVMLEEILALDALTAALRQDIIDAATAWVTGDGETLDALAQALKRVLLALVTTDL